MSKPVSASTPSLLELCQDEISLKFLTDAVQLSCGCYYNTETAEALDTYELPCIKHKKVSLYYEREERFSMIVKAVLQKETSSSGKELTPANVSTEIPEAAKSLYEKGQILFLKQLFTEAALAFLGATLQYPSYTEAQNSLASALKFIPMPSSGPQISSSAIPMPGASAPTEANPPRTNPDPTPAAASRQSPASAPVYNIGKLNTGTIVHNNSTTYAPVTTVTDAHKVDKKVYAPRTTYAPQTSYRSVTVINDARKADKKIYAPRTSYHINYGAPASSGGGNAPAPAEPQQNRPVELPAYVKNAKTPEGKGKALIKAIDKKERDMVDYLLENGAKLDAQDEKNRTPLQAACEGNWPEVVQLLIENGAKTEGENLTLIAAAKAQYREVVKILVRQNTPYISLRGSYYHNYSATRCEVFEVIIRNGDIELAIFFLEEIKIDLQAPIDHSGVKNDSGDTIAICPIFLGEQALDIACEIQNLQLVQLLLDKGAKVNKSLLVATEKRNLPILELLCSNVVALHPGPSRAGYEYFTFTLKNQTRPFLISQPTYADFTLLKACEKGDVEFVRLLVKVAELKNEYKIDVGYKEYVYVRLAEIAYGVASKQEIKDLFPVSIRTPQQRFY